MQMFEINPNYTLNTLFENEKKKDRTISKDFTILVFTLLNQLNKKRTYILNYSMALEKNTKVVKRSTFLTPYNLRNETTKPPKMFLR